MGCVIGVLLPFAASEPCGSILLLGLVPKLKNPSSDGYPPLLLGGVSFTSFLVIKNYSIKYASLCVIVRFGVLWCFLGHSCVLLYIVVLCTRCVY